MKDIWLPGAIDWLMSHPYLVIVTCLLYMLLALVVSHAKNTGNGKNPFAQDHRRHPEPFVHDTKSRDSVLKQKFKASKIPEDIDTIIVGSGVGGLTAAVLLGRVGQKVLVLEQHDQAGGCCHSFVEKGFEFDTGIHYIGNVHEGSDTRTLLDSLTCGQLRWTKMDDAFDTCAVGEPSKATMYPMKSGKEEYVQNLINLFPQEREAILKYMDMITDAANSFMGVVILKALPMFIAGFLVKTGLYRFVFSCWRKGYSERTLQQVLDSLTDNKDLKCVLSYVCGDYGKPPRDVPFLLHSTLIKHYQKGAYYPTNGTSEIPFHMCQAIQENGGHVLVKAPVSKIICDENGRCVGVTVAGKTSSVDIMAKNIISDAGLANTFSHLLPQEVAQKSSLYPMVKNIGPSCSYITTFFGVEGSSKDLNLPAGNIWLYRNNDINKLFQDFLDTKKDDLEDADFLVGYISIPSAKDPEYEKKYPGRTSIMVITLGRWEWFEEWKDEKLRHRGDRYNGIKDVIGRRLWELVIGVFPQCDGKLVYTETGTPVTNSHYLGEPHGEMYGLDNSSYRFSAEAVYRTRCDVDIPGLWLTGQDTVCCGFTAALMSGVITASHVIKRNLWRDLGALQKRLYRGDHYREKSKQIEKDENSADQLKKKE